MPEAEEKVINPGLDPRAGEIPDEMSDEMVMLLTAFRELAAHQQIMFNQFADVMKSHMSRQNLILDKIVFGISINTAALEAMHGPNQTMVYNSRVSQMHALRKHKVEQMQAMLDVRRTDQESKSDASPPESEGQGIPAV